MTDEKAEGQVSKPNPEVKPPPYGWFTHGYDPAKPNPGDSEKDGKKAN